MKKETRITLLLLVLAFVIVLTYLRFQTINQPVNSQGYQFTQDWVYPNANNWLEVLGEFKDKPNVHALEIGSFEGFSSIWFVNNILTHPTSKITCIDIFVEIDYEDRFDHNVQYSGRSDQFIKIKGNSQIVLRKLELESYDFIYIDGDHRAQAVLIDAVFSWDLLKPGGYLIFDDYKWGEEAEPMDTPKPAIDSFLQFFGKNVTIIKSGWQMILKKESSFLPPSDYEEGNRSTELIDVS